VAVALFVTGAFFAGVDAVLVHGRGHDIDAEREGQVEGEGGREVEDGAEGEGAGEGPSTTVLVQLAGTLLLPTNPGSQLRPLVRPFFPANSVLARLRLFALLRRRRMRASVDPRRASQRLASQPPAVPTGARRRGWDTLRGGRETRQPRMSLRVHARHLVVTKA
jgi:hypothetical protein